MDNNDRQAIEGLFSKLGDVERQAGPRDAEAERFITDSIGRQPGAPYYMAQTIVIQEQALANQQRRIEALEQAQAAAAAEPRQQEGGMLSRIFGSSAAPRSVPSVGGSRTAAPRAGGAWGNAGGQPEGGPGATPGGYAPQGRSGFGGAGGGGFLAGAAQTAMGVAGGVLLGNALGNMFGGNEAQAATPAAEASPAADAAPAAEPSDNAADQGQEPGVQDASADDGGWFGGDDGGGFDEI